MRHQRRTPSSLSLPERGLQSPGEHISEINPAHQDLQVTLTPSYSQHPYEHNAQQQHLSMLASRSSTPNGRIGSLSQFARGA